jgi:hypothetical protein
VRIPRTIVTGVFLGWICQPSMAESPPLDRPTPPPCCADGQCFASPLTYGYYDTRWRRWPLECLAQATPGQVPQLPAPLRQEIAPFVRPPAEQEDRKAPPPSVPAGEQTPATGTGVAPRGPGGPAGPGGPMPPQGTQPPGGPAGPATPPPTTAPIVPPAAQGTQPSTAPQYKTISPDSPLNKSGPMGDVDPPPALPFGPALVAPETPIREAIQRPAAMPVQRPSGKPAESPSGDPPPAPPVSLASYVE